MITALSPALSAWLTEVHARGECLHPTTPAERSLVRRYQQAGLLTVPYRGLYDDTATWCAKDPHEQARTLLRTLHRLHPQWVATDIAAQDFQGIEHGRQLHTDIVTITDRGCNAAKRHTGPGAQLIRMRVPASLDIVTVRGLPMTPTEVSVMVAVPHLPFTSALPMVDSALRQGLSTERLEETAAFLRRLDGYVRALLRCGDPLSENGGESYVRAVIMEMGFAAPRLQVEFRRGGRTVRVDFLWELPDGRLVVLELDGRAKYVDPAMTHGRSPAKVAVEQLDRDEFLRDCGVNTVVHVLFEEAVRRVPLQRKLVRAGVPLAPSPMVLQPTMIA
ncbi:hypothetical protein [Bifidobacterium cuniculi]|uniref:hypothetical protein n=1 Tax=Bifidobacterium cuniculi TaxID=1688 RepID=UPI00069075A1|nr:hypothetical protein [Bifidobacterium cuniculi]